MIPHLLGYLLCGIDLHDTGTRRTGLCRRCHLYVHANGSVHR